MTLKELLSKLPIEVQNSFNKKVSSEFYHHETAKILLDNGSSITFKFPPPVELKSYHKPYGWTDQGYYSDKQDIDF